MTTTWGWTDPPPWRSHGAVDFVIRHGDRDDGDDDTDDDDTDDDTDDDHNDDDDDDDDDDTDDDDDPKNDSYTAAAGAAPGASVPCSLFLAPSFRFLRSSSFVLVPSFWFLRSGSFVPVPSFRFLRSGSFVRFRRHLLLHLQGDEIMNKCQVTSPLEIRKELVPEPNESKSYKK